jgi:hypothetical protein
MLADEEVEKEATTVASSSTGRETLAYVTPARAEVFRRSSARITPATISIRGRPT